MNRIWSRSACRLLSLSAVRAIGTMVADDNPPRYSVAPAPSQYDRDNELVVLQQQHVDRMMHVRQHIPEEKFSNIELLRLVCGRPQLTAETTKDYVEEILQWRESVGFAEVVARVKACAGQEEFRHAASLRHVMPQMTIAGRDRDGNPVSFMCPGKVDPLEMKFIERQQVQQFFIDQLAFVNAHLNDQSLSSGTLRKLTRVVDLDGIGLRHFLSRSIGSLARVVLELGEVYFPGTNSRTIIVNAPDMFAGFFNRFIVPCLRNYNRHKIVILGHDYRDTLLEYVDRDNLPEFLGGQYTQCDIGLPSHRRSEIVVVPSRQSMIMEIPLSAHERAEFVIDSALQTNIDLEVRYRSCEMPDQEQVVAEKRTLAGQMNGAMEAPSDGILVIELDNSKSILTKKIIRVQQSVQPCPIAAA